MANFIEFPVFDGVSRDLRSWISWLEDFFVREKFTALEKMNLGQSLLAGEAESWFYSQKRSIFQSWEHLVVELLIWRFGDFGDGGVFSDLELFLFWNKYDRILRKRRKRMTTTSIPEKNLNLTASRETTDSTVATKSIQEAISESVLDGDASIEKDESYEATMVKVEDDTTMFQVSDSLEEESIHQNQVPVSSLEPSLSFSSESLDVSQAWQSEIVSNNRVHSQAGVGCVKNKNNAYHVFDELFRMLHDPGGKKEEHSDDILETEVDIDNVQRTQMDNVAASVITTPDNVASSSNDAAPSTDVIIKQQTPACVVVKYSEPATYAQAMHTEGWDEACAAEIDALEGTGTGFVTSLPARCGWLVFDRGKNGQIQWTEIQKISLYKAMVAAPIQQAVQYNKLFAQVSRLDDSHLAQIFNEGLKPEMQEVLKLTAPVDVITRVFLDLKTFLCEKVHRVSCLSLPAQFHSLEFQLKHKWRSKHEAVLELLEPYGWSGARGLGQLILVDLKSHMRHKWKSILCELLEVVCVSPIGLVDALQSGFGENVHISLAADVNELQFLPECVFGNPNAEQVCHRLLFLRQQKSSSIWHRWRRKGELKEEKPRVNQRLLIQWPNRVSCENSWMFSMVFVHLYPSFKLEDKLGLQGVSIVMNHQAYHEKIAIASGVVAEHFKYKEALGRIGGFAV